MSFGEFITAEYPSLTAFLKRVEVYMLTATKDQPAFDLFNALVEEFCSFSRASPVPAMRRSDEELRVAVLATTLSKLHRSEVLFAAHMLVFIESLQKETGIPLPEWFQTIDKDGYGQLFERTAFLLETTRSPTTSLH